MPTVPATQVMQIGKTQVLGQPEQKLARPYLKEQASYGGACL
jgi:hypothetical protein